MIAEKKNDRLQLILGLVVIVLLAANSLVWYNRLDMTQNKAFTVSKDTLAYIKTIQEPVRVQYYVSQKILTQLPQIQNISDLLEEYARLSNGKVQLELIRVDGNEDELNLKGMGLQSQQFQVVEQNQLTAAMVYSGLKISYLNKRNIVPFVADPGDLEYQLTLGIKKLVEGKTPVLGILNGKDQYDTVSQYTLINRYFGQMFTIRTLSPGELIPLDIDVLLVLGDETLGDEDAKNIDAFIQSGKGTIIGLDRMSVDVGQQLTPRPLAEGKVLPLVRKYGFDIKDSWVMDPSSASMPIQQNQGGITFELQQPYPLWVRSKGALLNKNHPLTASLPELDFLWANPLVLPEDQSDVTVLASSSRKSSLQTSPNADPYMVSAMLQGSQEEQKSYPLAALLEKPLDSKKTDSEGKALKTKLVLLGDSDFVSDMIQVSQSVSNLEFMLNLYEGMAYDSSIMSLRNRVIENAKLDKIEDLQEKNAYVLLIQVLNTVLIPLALIVFALLRLYKRKQRARQSLRGEQE